MDVRTQFGELVDKVVHTHQRFVIQRRGKAKALLVPIDDGKLIAEAIDQQTDSLDATYAAFEQARGMITDPAMHNASSTIDSWLYGQPVPSEAGEHHEP